MRIRQLTATACDVWLLPAHGQVAKAISAEVASFSRLVAHARDREGTSGVGPPTTMVFVGFMAALLQEHIGGHNKTKMMKVCEQYAAAASPSEEVEMYVHFERLEKIKDRAGQVLMVAMMGYPHQPLVLQSMVKAERPAERGTARTQRGGGAQSDVAMLWRGQYQKRAPLAESSLAFNSERRGQEPWPRTSARLSGGGATRGPRLRLCGSNAPNGALPPRDAGRWCSGAELQVDGQMDRAYGLEDFSWIPMPLT